MSSRVLSVPEAFDQLLKNIQPSDEEYDFASKNACFITDFLKRNAVVETAFYSGSYKRKTAVKPLNDVDIFVVLRLSVSNSPENAFKTLDSLAKNLQDAHPGTFRVRKQERSTRLKVESKTITFDLVPAISFSKHYKIPNRSDNSWIETHPDQTLSSLIDANARSNLRLNPLIKLLKSWNNHAKGQHFKKPFKSFHLEVMCYGLRLEERVGFAELLKEALLFIYDIVIHSRPVCAPKTNQRVDEYLDNKSDQEKRGWTRKDVVQLISVDWNKCKEALESTIIEVKHSKFRQLFGKSFYP